MKDGWVEGWGEQESESLGKRHGISVLLCPDMALGTQNVEHELPYPGWPEDDLIVHLQITCCESVGNEK